MPTVIKLIDFIRTAKFGPIELGMNKSEIISHLGKGEEGYKSSIWYGSYELFFQEESKILIGLQNDHLFNHNGRNGNAALFQNDKFIIDSWILSPGKNVTYSECISSLWQENITYEEKHEWGLYKIQFNSGVYLSFDNYDGTWTVSDTEVKKSNIVIDQRENYILEGIRLYGDLF